MDLERLIRSMPAGSIPSSKRTLKVGIADRYMTKTGAALAGAAAEGRCRGRDRPKPAPTAVSQILRFFRAQIEYWQESSQMTIADTPLRIRRRPFRAERQPRPHLEDDWQIRHLVHQCG